MKELGAPLDVQIRSRIYATRFMHELCEIVMSEILFVFVFYFPSELMSDHENHELYFFGGIECTKVTIGRLILPYEPKLRAIDPTQILVQKVQYVSVLLG